MVRGPRRGPRRHQADRRPAEGAAAKRGQAQARGREEGAGPGARRPRSRPRSPAPLLEPPCASRASSRRYAAMKQVKDDFVASLPEDRAGEEAAGAARSTTACARRSCADEILENGRRLDGRALRRDPPDHLRGRRAAAHPRLGALHPRRDPGPGHRHPGHLRGRADHRHRAGAEYEKRFMLHYNFPPFSVGRGEVPARPRPARDRPRRPRRARPARRCCPTRRPSPTRSASSPTSWSRNGSSSMASICGGTLALMDAGVPLKAPVAGRGHGPGQGGRQVRRPLRHRGRGRPLRRHGLQGRGHPRRASPPCRWTSRSAASPPRSWPRRWSRPGRAGCTSSTRWPRRWPRRAPSISALRAAHHHHQDPGRQDPRHHRPRRQDDPLHRRADRLQDRRRGRRPRVHRLGRRGRGPARPSPSSRS